MAAKFHSWLITCSKTDTTQTHSVIYSEVKFTYNAFQKDTLYVSANLKAVSAAYNGVNYSLSYNSVVKVVV